MPWLGAPRLNGAWNQRDSTRCDPAASTSTSGLPIWTELGSGLPCASRPWSQGSADRSTRERANKDLGLACLRAFNDWHHDVWAGTYPERIIPLQLPYLADVSIAVDEVRRNAARGFKAVSFPEFPAQLHLPSIFSGQWDPFFAECEVTGTVVCLHTGASSWAPLPSPDPPFELLPTLFPVNALVAAGEWLWSGVPLRFPGLNIAMSEGGIGWVPMLMDRADYVLKHSGRQREHRLAFVHAPQ